MLFELEEHPIVACFESSALYIHTFVYFEDLLFWNYICTVDYILVVSNFILTLFFFVVASCIV